jgi:hypothetical protein
MSKDFTPNFGYVYGTNVGLNGLSGGFTISAWVVDESGVSTKAICSDWHNTSTSNRHLYFRTNSNVLEGVLELGNTQIGGTFGTAALGSKWRNVIYHWDGATLRGFLDGVVGPTTYAAAGTTDGDSVNNFHIGNEARATTQGWDGRIAEFAIWNVPLTLSEIYKLLHYTPPTVRRNSLVFHTPLRGADIHNQITNLMPTFNGAGSVLEGDNPPVVRPARRPRVLNQIILNTNITPPSALRIG